MKFAKRTVALALFAALGLSACSSGGAASPDSENVAAREGGDLQIAWNAQPASLDPVAVTSTTTRDIMNNVFEGLYALDATATPQPMLAEGVEANEDYTEFVFKLREGVLFHNGDEMKSSDVVASFERWIRDSAVGQSDFAEAVVTAEGDYSVKVTVPESFYTLVEMTMPPNQGLIIVPEESLSALTETGIAEDSLIGTGPYKFAEWKKDQSIKLERFDDYQSLETEASGLAGAKEAYLDSLTFHVVPDATTRANGLQTGQYDFASSLSTDSYAQLESSGVNLSSEFIYQFYFVTNKASGFFANHEAREGLFYAIDPEPALTAAYSTSDFYALNGAISNPNQTNFYSETGVDDRYNNFDPEKAAELFESAGYDGSTIRVLTTREYADSYNASVVLEQQLKDAGLNVELVVTDQATVVSSRAEVEGWDIFPTAIGFGAPETVLPLKSNWAGLTDSPQIEEALENVRLAVNDEDLYAARESVQQAFYDYAPAVKLGDGASLNGFSKDVSGYSFLYGPIFYNISLAQ